jgi:drug/metabolite transporter (DMT)-like permease
MVIIYVVWGSTYLAIRVAVETIPPFLMGATRFLVAGSILFVWARRRGDVAGDALGPRQWAAAGLIGGLLLLGGNGALAWAEQRVASGVAALVVALIPIWMALLTSWINRERIWGGTIAGLIIGLGGTALLVRAGGSDGEPLYPFGVVVLVACSIFWSLGSVLSRRVPLPRRPLVATGMEMLAGGALLALVGVASGELGNVHLERLSAASLLGLGWLIAAGSLIAFSAYVWLLNNAPMPLISTYAYVNPVVAVFLGWWVLAEPVTGLMLLAGGLIVGAVALIVNTEARKRREGDERTARRAPAMASTNRGIDEDEQPGLDPT